MAVNGSVTLAFGGEDRVFNLAIIKYALEHQELCNAGPQEVVGRFINGTWRLPDLRETIRLGLIGGGLEPNKAQRLVKLYVDERPWLENVPLAKVIMMAALIGVPGDQPGKPSAEPTTTEAPPSSAMGALSVPQSTGSAPPLDSAQE